MGSLLIISFILLTLNIFLVFPAISFPSNSKPPPLPQVSAKAFFDCVNNILSIQEKAPLYEFYSAAVNKTKFTAVLDSTAQNLRLLENTVSKPKIIFRPIAESQVSPAILCARGFGLNVRIRSGGHDYEGLSFASLIKNQQFMILDLFNLRDIQIDTDTNTAWVQAGATNGELYYKLSQVDRTLAFPAGLCSDLGMGGHPVGGGYGFMMRQFGLAADNMLDVRMVDSFGLVRSYEYKNMDDDLFWALSGGGGGNFGVILAWQIKLVTVPWNVTMFTSVIPREAKGAEILQKWQKVASKVDRRFFIRVIMQTIPTGAKTKTVLSIYQGVFLGSAKEAVDLMRRSFPEIGVASVKNCTEMSWIEAVMNVAGFPAGTDPSYLLQVKPAFQILYMKAKSDFLRDVMPVKGIDGLWNIFMEQGSPSTMIWNPYGAKMAEIPMNATPFPHREGVISMIQYVATWTVPSAAKQLEMEDWMRRMYAYMTPYVSKNPREAYVNYRDLDIGKKDGSSSNCSYPAIWGPKYFKDNYNRLVIVKTMVDPFNFFNNEQSIPTIWNQNQCTQVI